MGVQDFLARLDPKTAARIKTAQETEIERLPLISYGLTKALGGGIAKGRLCTVYGNFSAGKSALFQETIGKLWQPAGLVCAYYDVEGAYDKEWAAKLGIDNSELMLFHSKSSGKIEEDIVPLLDAQADVVIIDSISDIMPEAFIGKDGAMNNQIDRKQLGAQAKAITALVNGLLYANENTAIVLLSQTTTEINPTHVKQIPHGGKKVLFASSQIVKLVSSGTEGQQIKGDFQVGDLTIEQPVGRKVTAYVEKNKLGRQSATCEYDLYYAGKKLGIDRTGEIIKEALKYKIFEKGAKSAWINWGEMKWQGEPNATKHFEQNPEDMELLLKQITMVETGEVLDESLV
jgi:recombination protein RecA